MLRPKAKMSRPRGRSSAASDGRSSNQRHSGRSSVLLETETMRLKTMGMVSEADDRSDSARKLRRENDQLKQQLWLVRDEYQQLESFVEELEQVALDDAGQQTGADGDVAAPRPLDGDWRSAGGGLAADSVDRRQLTVIVPGGASISVTNDRSSSPDGMPDPRQCSAATKHFNLDRLMNVVHSFHVDRDSYCVTGQQTSDEGRADDSGQASAAGTRQSTVRVDAVSQQSVAADALHNTAMRSADAHGTSDRTYMAQLTADDGVASRHSQCSLRQRSVSQSSVALCGPGRATLLRINCVEPNTVMFSTDQSPALRGLTAPQVIDELQRQVDPGLTEVRGVRAAGDSVFVCMASRRGLSSLLDGRLTVRGVLVDMVDITVDSVVLMLSGVPHYVSDGSVHVLMNNFGLVIGEIERRFYKGIDTGDRLLRLKPTEQVTVPRYVTVGGSRIAIHALKHDEVACALRPDQCLLHSSRPSSPAPPEPPPSGGYYVGCGTFPQRRRTGTDEHRHSVESLLDSRTFRSEEVPPPPENRGFTSRLQIHLRPRSVPDVSTASSTATTAHDSVSSCASAPGDIPGPPPHYAQAVGCALADQHAPITRNGCPAGFRRDVPSVPADGKAASARNKTSKVAAETVPKQQRTTRLSSLRLRIPRISQERRSSSDSHVKPGGPVRSEIELAPDSAGQQSGPDSAAIRQRGRVAAGSLRRRLVERRHRRRRRSELSDDLATIDSQDDGRSSSSGSSGCSDSQDISDLPWCGCWGNGCF